MYDITNKFVFPRVMENPKLCLKFIKTILKDENIPYMEELTERDITIEKELVMLKSKNVKLDVHIMTLSRDVINLEMQNQNRKKDNIEKRGRVYHARITSEQIGKGEYYGDLKSSTVVFLCMFDYYGKNLPFYSFEGRNCRQDQGLKYEDGTCTIIVNLTYEGELLSEEMQQIFRYFRDSTVSEDNELVRMLHEEVTYVNECEGGTIMTLEEDMRTEIRLVTDEVTERVTNEVTEKVTNDVTEKVTSDVTERIAKSMIQNGYSLENIARVTGIDLEDLNVMAREMNILQE